MNPKSKLPKSTTKVPAAKKPVKHPEGQAFWNKPAAASEPEKKLPKVVVEDGHATIQDDAPVADAPVEAAAAPEPEVVTTATKKAAKKKAKAAETTGDQKPTPPPAEDGLVVFALRMTLDERTRLHETAGPAKASRFARAILIAAANRDVDRLREIIAATKPAS